MITVIHVSGLSGPISCLLVTCENKPSNRAAWAQLLALGSVLWAKLSKVTWPVLRSLPLNSSEDDAAGNLAPVSFFLWSLPCSLFLFAQYTETNPSSTSLLKAAKNDFKKKSLVLQFSGEDLACSSCKIQSWTGCSPESTWWCRMMQT